MHVFVGVSWYGAAFLLINTALGAGILNYPEAYDRAGGIVSSTFIQLVSKLTSQYQIKYFYVL